MKAIRDRIEAGELKAGQKIESERELSILHRVSLMTARHALQALEADGIVTRHVGAGTFVAPPKIHINRLLGFTEMMAMRGMSAQSKLLSLSISSDNEEVVAKLRQPAGSPLIRLERLRLGDGEPFALETVYVPQVMFKDIPLQQLERRSLFEIFQRDYGMVLAYADEEMDATSADARTAKHLGISPGAPVLRIRQLLFAEKGDPILYDIGLYRNDRHSLVIRRFR